MEQQYAPWVPCHFHQPHWGREAAGDFELANWIMEPAVWSPALPVESVSSSTEMFGSSCLQTYVPSSYTEGLQVHCNYAAATQNDLIDKESAREFEVGDIQNVEMEIHHMFEETAAEFKAGLDMMKEKIHRYPASFRALGDWYTVPRMVSIGPYHHGQDNLKPAEKVKHLAAYHCVKESGDSGHTLQEMYDAVVQVAYEARSLYHKDVMAGIGDDDFLPMMFYDACFLVQFMFRYKHRSGQRDPGFIDPSLERFFIINDHEHEIFHDITLLENQIPWRVVKTILKFRPVPLEDVVASFKGILQDHKDPPEKPIVLDDSYKPPHLLGFLRFYIVGRSNSEDEHRVPETRSISISVSAIELAEIGIRLRPNKTTELIRMGMEKKGFLFAELSLAPLTLDDKRASCLVNMAALEMCSVRSFSQARDEDSAVCSYLLLFSMIVEREEDVHELRTRHLLQGGAGLSNSDTLQFFTELQSLRIGSRYFRIMKQIESYKVRNPMRIKVHAFVYKNQKTIITVFSVTAALIGILGTLMSLKIPH